jgi:hypothetical protein
LSEHDNITELRNRAFERLRPHWLAVLRSLKLMFPLADVTGRLRPDIYGDGDNVLSRDSAGVRVINVNASALNQALCSISDKYIVSGIRDYRDGHPRSSYYRGVHLYVRREEFDVEVQLRTQRQHLIAEWAHDRLFIPSTEDDWDLILDQNVLTFLGALSAHYDQLDNDLFPTPLPMLPAPLRPHARSLGVGDTLVDDQPHGDS